MSTGAQTSPAAAAVAVASSPAEKAAASPPPASLPSGVDILAAAALSHSSDGEADGVQTLKKAAMASKLKKNAGAAQTAKPKRSKSSPASSTSSSNSSTELKSPSPPADFNQKDVLSGRGGATNLHPGNRFYRELILEHRSVYDMASKGRKPGKCINNNILILLLNCAGPNCKFMPF
jgi:hypothetical protein